MFFYSFFFISKNWKIQNMPRKYKLWNWNTNYSIEYSFSAYILYLLKYQLIKKLYLSYILLLNRICQRNVPHLEFKWIYPSVNMFLIPSRKRCTNDHFSISFPLRECISGKNWKSVYSVKTKVCILYISLKITKFYFLWILVII